VKLNSDAADEANSQLAAADIPRFIRSRAAVVVVVVVVVVVRRP